MPLAEAPGDSADFDPTEPGGSERAPDPPEDEQTADPPEAETGQEGEDVEGEDEASDDEEDPSEPDSAVGPLAGSDEDSAEDSTEGSDEDSAPPSIPPGEVPDEVKKIAILRNMKSLSKIADEITAAASGSWRQAAPKAPFEEVEAIRTAAAELKKNITEFQTRNPVSMSYKSMLAIKVALDMQASEIVKAMKTVILPLLEARIVEAEAEAEE